MHYLCATWDGGGTVPIDLGIVRRVIERGHTVTVLGDPTMADDVRRRGAEFVPWREAPHRRSSSLEDDVLKDWEVRHNPIALFRRVSDRLITGPAAAFARETALELERRRPDVALVDAVILGPMVATEAAGIPTVGVCPGFYVLPAPGMPPFGMGLRPARGRAGRARDDLLNGAIRWAWRSGLPALNAARAEHGLPPLADPWDQLRRCTSVLVTTARAYDFPAELPDNAHYVGPILDDPAWAVRTEHEGSRDGSGAPLVVVGLSSTHVVGQVDLLRRIAAALASLPVRAVVCTGPAVDPADVPSSGGVEVVRAAPHDELFPRAAVVVTHGGHGTMTKALAAGTPVLCLPGFRDTKDNAVRATERGAGLRLRPSAPPRAIADAVRRLLVEPRFARAAATLGARIRAEVESSPLVGLLEGAAHPVR